MLFWHTVELSKLTFGLVPEVLNPIDVVALLHKGLGVINTAMFEVRHIQHVIRTVPIGVDNAVWHDLLVHDAQQSVGLGV